jgi:hypothetical protein
MREIGAEAPHPAESAIKRSPDDRIGGRAPGEGDHATRVHGSGMIVVHGGLMKGSSKVTHVELTEINDHPQRSGRGRLIIRTGCRLARVGPPREWHVDVAHDLKSIKITMQMDLLRCKTPELVRKEIWTHVLAYNLIRTIMAQAARQIDIEPRSVSFNATIQILEAFQPVIAHQGHWGTQLRQELYQQLLKAIATHRVADRPDRFQPRMMKRRPKNYDRLTRPRREIKREMIKRFSEN